MITYEEIRKNEDIRTYIQSADEALAALGFTEHSFAHVTKVAESVKYILETLGFSAHAVELGMIAAYLHDIGNIVNRTGHAQSGAVMAFRILDHMGFTPDEIGVIVSAIGNHDEGTADPVNPIAAALILADKTDVRRSRVRNKDVMLFDIHDRVNFSVEQSQTKINDGHSVIELNLTIDPQYCSVMDYFEIFLERMVLCRKAAERLGMQFQLVINRQRLL